MWVLFYLCECVCSEAEHSDGVIVRIGNVHKLLAVIDTNSTWLVQLCPQQVVSQVVT